MTLKRRELPILTRAESEVMQLLWRHGPATVAELVERVPRDLAYTTVLTIVRILEQKGYATHDRPAEGERAHRFRAAVEEGGVRKRHVRDLVDRLFGGAATSLVSGLIDDEALDRDQLKALREQIDRRLGPRKGGR